MSTKYYNNIKLIPQVGDKCSNNNLSAYVLDSTHRKIQVVYICDSTQGTCFIEDLGLIARNGKTVGQLQAELDTEKGK